MANSNFRDELKRLFSGQVIIRHKGGKKLKVIDTNQLQSKSAKNYLDRYSRLYSSMAGSTGKAMQFYQAGQRIALFKDYEQMDADAILASALDIYADESTLKSEYGDVLKITSDNEEIKEILYNLYYDILNIEFNLWPWVRNLCKYGDFFLHLMLKEKYGIFNVIPLSVYDVVRLEGVDPMKPNEVQFQMGQGETLGTIKGENVEMLQEYEVAHFRLNADSNYLPYGKSMIEGARKVWKQLTLMEDAMLIHRIMRAPEKRIFKVDIGSLSPAEVEPYMKAMMNKMKKTPIMDQQTGDYNLRYNMQNLTEDFFLPVRGGDSGTEIDTLQGMDYDMSSDIEYLKNKMLAALKVPKAFLGYDDQLNSKATLAAEDVRFARTIERVQRTLVSELTKIGVVHLYTQGYTDEKLLSFELELTNPSTIYEEEKIELLNNKISAASAIISDDLMDMDWIYENIFKFSDEEVNKIRLGKLRDKKRQFRWQQIEDEGNDPLHSGEAVGTQGDMIDNGGQQGQRTPSGFQEEGEEMPKGGWPGSGRPPEGDKYGKDSSVTGRDPLGKHDMKKAGSSAPKYGKTLRVAGYDAMVQKLGKTFVETNKQMLAESEDIENEYKEDITPETEIEASE